MRITRAVVAELIATNPGVEEDAIVQLAVRKAGKRSPAATKDLRRRVRLKYRSIITEGEDVGGVLKSMQVTRPKLTHKTLVFTSAQNNTRLHEGFWKALRSYCEERDAELHVSRFRYNRNAHTGKVGTDTPNGGLWYDPRIVPFISDEHVQVAKGLVWCGELNILPTATNPLSGFDTYTRADSCMIPHTKMLMQSVPTLKYVPAKHMFTTGAVTQRNYIQKKAGQKAEFHHVYGALVVEIADDGEWFVRQINATDDGGFIDLDREWLPSGKSRAVKSCAAITHGDIHGLHIDGCVMRVVWGKGGVVDRLRPELQVFHDTVDFTPRNHHNINDPVHLGMVSVDGGDDVEREFRWIGKFLSTTAYRGFSKAVLIMSNHDMAIEKWLNNHVGFYDGRNSELWLELNYARMRARKQAKAFSCFQELLSRHLVHDVTFVQEDESYRVGDIEYGLHGHLGPNGARGTPRNLRTVGKANTGHTHSPGIYEGVYVTGTYSNLDLGYNKGLSSWAHACTVTYRNSKRALLLIKGGRAWR